jgi:D-serine deaminase-like pyridoxal phosphate-dependent protein
MTYERMSYPQYRDALNGRSLPCALINLDALDANIATIRSWVDGTGKKIRVATKSIRVPWVLDYLRQSLGDLYSGLMCLTVEEAVFLHAKGFDDLLVAYPSVQPSDLKQLASLTKKGVKVSLIVDSEQHLRALSEVGAAKGVELCAVIEIDMSYRPFGDATHLGVRRSPVRKAKEVLMLARLAESLPGVRLAGLMGYEAQVAGLTDSNPFTKALNPIKKLIKKRSIPEVTARRRLIANLLAEGGIEIELFNGGGTGSVKTTPPDDPITEVTAGSGFFCSHLFDYFENFKLLPAAFFALQVVRFPKPGMVACLGGGYVASGESHLDKQPLPYLPGGLSLLPVECAGETQTPLTLPKNAPDLGLGDPVLFRHAKAGELSERFNGFLLIRDGKVIGEEKTYRGFGKAIL